MSCSGFRPVSVIEVAFRVPEPFRAEWPGLWVANRNHEPIRIRLDITPTLHYTGTMNPREQIGLGWLAAIIALAVLLAIGIVMYLRMSAPISASQKRGTALLLRIRHKMCSTSVISAAPRV